MSTEHSTTEVVVVMHEDSSFLKDKIDLKKLRRELGKASAKTIETLVKLLDSQNEDIRLKAAVKLMEYEILVAKEINSDAVQRLIAEIKLNRGPKTAALGSTQENRPLVDFGTIREIED